MKEKIQAEYLRQWGEYNARTRPLIRKALVIGASEGNIGQAIFDALPHDEKHSIDVSSFDITKNDGLFTTFLPDTLIICAGYSHLDWFERCPSAEARATFEINLIAPFFLAQDWVRRTMMEMPGALKTLIFIGSMAYRAILNGSAAYCASKAGLAHLSECLAWELAPKGFNVFCIHPSNTLDSPMSEKTIQGLMRYRGLTRTDAETYWSSVCPMPDFLTKSEIADMVLFLCEHGYLAGSNIELKGAQR